MSYDDIINLEHHVSAKHRHMSNYDRAAQFAPFAALTGFEDELEETARLTDEKRSIDSDDEKMARLNRTILYLNDHINDHPEIEITYFKPDVAGNHTFRNISAECFTSNDVFSKKPKNGGEYLTATGNYKRIDQSEFCLIFTDGRKFHLTDIFEITLLKE